MRAWRCQLGAETVVFFEVTLRPTAVASLHRWLVPICLLLQLKAQHPPLIYGVNQEIPTRPEKIEKNLLIYSKTANCRSLDDRLFSIFGKWADKGKPNNISRPVLPTSSLRRSRLPLRNGGSGSRPGGRSLFWRSSR